LNDLYLRRLPGVLFRVDHVLVNAGVWVATGAAAISFLALLLSLRNRREDLVRGEAYQVRSRVWAILDREPGLRTILALHACDGQTPSAPNCYDGLRTSSTSPEFRC
jgi:hypothetical protein